MASLPAYCDQLCLRHPQLKWFVGPWWLGKSLSNTEDLPVGFNGPFPSRQPTQLVNRCLCPANAGLGLVARVWLTNPASEGVPVGMAGAAHPQREQQPPSLHPEGELFLSSEDSLVQLT